LGAGGAAFVRKGGTLTLVDPVFTGTISATGGTAQFSTFAGQGIGQGVFLGGTLTVNLSAGNSQTYTNDFLGGRGTQAASADPTNDAVGGLTKTGLGELILGNSSVAGPVNVSGGTLRMANTTTTASTSALLTVNSGGRLTGGTGGQAVNPFADSSQGFLNGGLTVNSGGTVSPGINAPGLLTVAGNVTLRAGSSFNVFLGSNNPRVTPSPVDNNVDSRILSSLDILFGASLTMPIDGGGQSFNVGNTYDFFVGKDSGNVGSLPASVTFAPTDFGIPVDPSNFALTRSSAGNFLILSFTPAAVPEPGSLGLVGVATAAVVSWAARRRRGTRIVRRR
jgi:hypothetical protein